MSTETQDRVRASAECLWPKVPGSPLAEAPFNGRALEAWCLEPCGCGVYMDNECVHVSHCRGLHKRMKLKVRPPRAVPSRGHSPHPDGSGI